MEKNNKKTLGVAFAENVIPLLELADERVCLGSWQGAWAHELWLGLGETLHFWLLHPGRWWRWLETWGTPSSGRGGPPKSFFLRFFFCFFLFFFVFFSPFFQAAFHPNSCPRLGPHGRQHAVMRQAIGVGPAGSLSRNFGSENGGLLGGSY